MTVLRILGSYPDGFAVMEDLKCDMAILATSGRDWADRTRRLAAGGAITENAAANPRTSEGERLLDRPKKSRQRSWAA